VAQFDARDPDDAIAEPPGPSGETSDLGFDLTSNVNYLLRRAHAHADRLFGEAMADLGITPRQAALLYAVGQYEGGNISMLVRLTGMDRGTLSEMAPRLVKRGLLSRTRAKADGRAKSLYLSSEGAAVVRRVTERTRNLQAKVLDNLPPEYHELFIKMLSLLVGLESETRTRTDTRPRQNLLVDEEYGDS
jgi:DNA-binding MarR family transcriptional regulator